MTTSTGALRATCPNCGARPDERCTAPTDTGRRAVGWVHIARVHAAADADPIAYLSLADVAERAGVNLESMRTYRKRAERNRASGDPRPGDLPREDITLGRTPGWATTTIDRWLASRPRAGARA